MTLYLDTSDLMKLYLDEADAGRIRQLVGEADVVATATLAYAEARATLARRRRERLLSAAEVTRAVDQLNADWPRFLTLPLDHDLARSAGRLADAHGLRGGDAVHLASLEDLLTRCEDADVRFSSADERLSKAARSLT